LTSAPRRSRRVVLPAALLGTATAGLLLYAGLHGRTSNQPTVTTRIPDAAAAGAIVKSLPPPELLKPVSSEEATKENADRPFVDRPDSPAAKFVLRTDAQDRERALNCLTQAVYYEAASEGADGQRAVAQVVLNRLHHPGYPSTVCGVVYQGAERQTGCQFTFVCDGSLQRTPLPAVWTRSRKIAEDALAGKVFAAVGHATHYHADYVLPYWADVLDKSVQIGRHIFYRLRGPVGDARGFSQRYGGTEPELPKPDAAVTLPATTATAALAATLASDAVTAAAPSVQKAAAPTSQLAIDDERSGLLIDGGAAPANKPHKTKRSAGCPAPDGSALTPLRANDMRASSDSTC